jgi:hypothetical protein
MNKMELKERVFSLVKKMLARRASSWRKKIYFVPLTPSLEGFTGLQPGGLPGDEQTGGLTANANGA